MARQPLAHVAGLLLSAALLLPAARADEGTNGCTELTFEGTASFKDLGPLGGADFQFDLRVGNETDAPIEVERANLLLGHPGGWLIPLDPESIDGSFFRTALTVPAGETRPVASQKYRADTPATHAMLFARAQDGPCAVAVPIQREGFRTPEPVAPTHPFGVGIVGPLHALRYSDGSHAVLLIGQHHVLDGEEPEDIETSITVGSDAGMAEPVRWKGLDVEGDQVALWPFVQRLRVHPGFEKGLLSIRSTATVGGEQQSFSGSWPVQRIDPIVLRAPVVGGWQLSNGPGQVTFHNHYGQPQFRYAYDMVKVENGRTHRGNPHLNKSYYAFGRDVKAAADGEIAAFCHLARDNPGHSGSTKQCIVNYVVLRHADEVYTAYLHIQQRSLRGGLIVGSPVRAGQVIASVGNSGNSPEPHLHFMAFTLDETGRMQALPTAFSNAWHDDAGTRRAVGVPLGGHHFHFLDR
jgi:hypothetical protein